MQSIFQVKSAAPWDNSPEPWIIFPSASPPAWAGILIPICIVMFFIVSVTAVFWDERQEKEYWRELRLRPRSTLSLVNRLILTGFFHDQSATMELDSRSEKRPCCPVCQNIRLVVVSRVDENAGVFKSIFKPDHRRLGLYCLECGRGVCEVADLRDDPRANNLPELLPRWEPSEILAGGDYRTRPELALESSPTSRRC